MPYLTFALDHRGCWEYAKVPPQSISANMANVSTAHDECDCKWALRPILDFATDFATGKGKRNLLPHRAVVSLLR